MVNSVKRYNDSFKVDLSRIPQSSNNNKVVELGRC